jgi:polar amino acid transport system permease protein
MENERETGSGNGAAAPGSPVLPASLDAVHPLPDSSAIKSGPARKRLDGFSASGPLFIGIGVAGAVGVFFLLGALNVYSLPFIIQTLPQGVGPAEISLEFTTYTFLLGFVGALGLGLVRAYPPRRDPAAIRKRARTRLLGWGRWPLYGFASGYVAAIRGTPFLVQLYVVYYAIIFTYPRFTLLGWDAAYWAGFFALLINTTGYQAEAIRGGFQSVDAGQVEGAKAVGLSRIQIFVRITLPQTLRLITLPLTNEWISNFKTATILSVIGIFELFNWSRTNVALYDAKPIEAFVMLTIFYLIVNVTLSRVVTYIEKIRRIPGLGTPIPEVGISRRVFSIGGGSGRSGFDIRSSLSPGDRHTPTWSPFRRAPRGADPADTRPVGTVR